MDETQQTEPEETKPEADPESNEETKPEADDSAQQHNADPVHSAADTAHTAAVEHLNDAALHGAGVARDRGGEPPA